MPRTKKAPGTAVDRRNGRHAELATGPTGVAYFDLPLTRDWRPDTRQAWVAFWSDPVASALTEVDRTVLLRWADNLDRVALLTETADKEPVCRGSMGQPVENPLYGSASRAMGVVEKCEAQLGIGALNRARLGIAIVTNKVALDDLNRKYAQPKEVADDDDPRD